jgi:hypothetical protein
VVELGITWINTFRRFKELRFALPELIRMNKLIRENLEKFCLDLFNLAKD